MPERPVRAYIAEFIGTLLLVLFIAVILTVQPPFVPGGRDFAVVGLLHAFVLFMLIATLGGVSGGHFNPAVTAGLAALRKIGPRDALVYILAQLGGAVCGALLAKLLLNHPGNLVNYGAPAPSALINFKTFTAALVELIGTFALVWAIMGLAVNPRGARDWAGLAIGATLGFAVMAFGPLTGAGLNPARSFGPALVANSWATGGGQWVVIYVVGPVLGAMLATIGYELLVLRPKQQTGERPIDKLA